MKPPTLPPALRLLLRYQMNARFRKLVRGAKTVKGALALVWLAGMFLVVPASVLLASLIVPRPEMPVGRTFIAPGLFAFCILGLLTTGTESGIFFLPAEIDLLFPAPFQRRQLLLYRLSGVALGILFLSLYFSVYFVFVTRHWVFGFIGMFLALSFVQLVPMALALVLSTVGARAYSRGRKVALAIVAVLGAAAAAQALAGEAQGGAAAFATRLRESGAAACLLAPFEVFSRAITAGSLFPEFAGWGLLALAIDVALVGLVLWLDADFLESSVVASQKLYERIERARRGQFWASQARSTAARRRIPMFPLWAGAGPIAWRHFVTALRGSRTMLVFLALLVGGTLLPSFLLGRDQLQTAATMSIGFVPWLSCFILPMLLQFDFRGDLECMDALKTLPASPIAVALGELITPIVVATLAELPLALAIGIAWGDWRLFAAAAAIVPVLNLMVFAVENLAFLWFPHRVAAVAGDFQAVGRQMLVMFVKFMVVSFVGGLAAAIGGLAWWLAGESWTASLAAVWCVLAAAGLTLVPLVARAFRSFDPSLEAAD